MHLSQLHYLPLTPLSFSILVGIYLVLLILIQIEALRYAYTRLGVTSGAALLLLIGSLVGSYFNIPVAQLPEQRVHTLAIHPYLQEDYVEPTYFPRERHRALLGIALYVVAGAIGWAYSPKLALLIFLLLPVFYGITSEGLTETRIGFILRRRWSTPTR